MVEFGRIDSACTFLFVPGNRPERFEKAARSGPDAVILDLEDSVPASDKAGARAAIERGWAHLQSLEVPLVLRINPLDTEAGQQDIAWMKPLASLAALVLPKAESEQAIAQLREELGSIAVLPIIETATGLQALPRLASAEGVARLVVGNIDFMADTGLQCDETESELAPLRFAVAMASRTHALAPAIDGVTAQIEDDERLRNDTRRALRFGFGGKLCIHPRQIAIVSETFAPSKQELDWARRVIAADAASGGAAVQLDGRMVDVPVVLQARRTLMRANRRGTREA